MAASRQFVHKIDDDAFCSARMQVRKKNGDHCRISSVKGKIKDLYVQLDDSIPPPAYVWQQSSSAPYQQSMYQQRHSTQNCPEALPGDLRQLRSSKC